MNRSIPGDVTTRIRELEKQLESVTQQSEKENQESLAKYRRVLEATSEGFLELDPEFRIVDYNSTISEMTGLSGKRLLQLPVENLYDKKTVHVHFASSNHLHFEAVFHNQAGDKFPLLFKRSILRDTDGKRTGYLVFLTELTELKQAQKDLQLAESRYRNMYQNAVQGMYQSTLEGKLLRVNPSFAQIFGYDQSDQLINSVGNISQLYKKQKDRQQLLSILLTNNVAANYEIEMQSRDGRSIWAMINARLTNDSDGTRLIEGILIDNTEKRLAENKLRRSGKRFKYLANHDSLTGLFNTRYLYKTLDKLIKESQRTSTPFSLVFLDMDNFKRIVDTYGHLNGSQALREVAENIMEHMFEPSFGVAYGGDEFVLVFPNTSKVDVYKHVQTIRQRIKDTVYLTRHGFEVQMSASFGVATFPDDAVDRKGLLALADEAMFHIKSLGKDGIGMSGNKKPRRNR